MGRNPLDAARATHLLALEPRVMFDGAAPASLHAAFAQHEAAHLLDRTSLFARTEPQARASEAHAFPSDAPAQADRSGDAEPGAAHATTPRPTASPVEAPAADASRQVIFIDTSLADYQQLARDWAKQGQVVLIDKDQDGLAQVEAALAGRSGLSAIHIVSHGEEGELLLGTTKLDESAITGALSQELATIGRSLAPGGDILVYGCDFAEGADGAQALNSLAQATGADVAASTNLTGFAPAGGDWTLEAHRGDIQARTLSDTAWTHTLDPGPVNAVPISVGADSLTVKDGAGAVIASGSTGFTSDNNTRSPNVSVGATARWANAASQNGASYDLVATIVSITANDTVRFLHPTGQTATNKPGDDPTFLLVDNSGTNNSNGDGASVQIMWRLVLTGTDTAAPADVTFNVLDIDGRNGQPNTRETVSAQANQLYYYTHETNSDIVFNYDPANNIVSASGTQDENNPVPTNSDLSTKSQASFSYKSTSGFTLTYSLAAANTVTRMAQFYHDGDSDFVFATPVYASIPHLDLDGDDSTATGTDAHFTFTEKGAAVPVVDTDVLVTNPESVNSIVSGSVTLTNAKAGDVLHVGTLPSNITATVSSSGGTITVSLSGAGSEFDYEAAYRAITFENTSAVPDTSQRVLTAAFTNDTNYSAAATSRIDVVAVNDAPMNTLPPTFTASEDVALSLSGISVSDVDAGAGSVTVTLSVPTGAGTLAAASAGGVTVSGSGGASITLTGTVSDLNGYLGSAATRPTYTGAQDASGDVTLTMVINDNGATGTGGPLTDTDTSTITITPVNDPPVNSLPTSFTVAEDSGPLGLTGISVSDVDAGAGAVTITLSVPTGSGSLAAGSAGGVTASGSGGASITLTGMLSDLNSYLAGAATRPTFTAAPDYNGAVTLTMVTNDSGNTGAGGARSDTDTSTITVTAVNDPPVNSLPAGYTVAEDSGPLSLSGVSVSDVDAGTGAVTITLSVPTGSGRLAAASAGGVTASGSGGASITLNGTLSDLNAYLGAAATRPTFTAALDYSGAVALTMLTNDNGASGAGGPQTDTDTSTITVTPVNDPPVNTLPANYTVAEDGGPLALSGISVGDVDAGAGAVTITLSVPGAAGSLAAASSGGVTASGSGGASLTLTGSLSALNSYLADASTRPTFTSALDYRGSVTLTMLTSDNGNTGAGGPQSDTDASTLTVTPVNHAPTASGTLPNQAAQDAQPVTYATARGFSDRDGDALTYSATGLPAGLAIDPATGVISGTLDRSASQANGGAYAVAVRATDASGTSATQTFALAVTDPAPTARDDAASTRAGSPVRIAVLPNDSDPDGDPLTVTGAGAPGHGAVAVNADGTLTYTPDAGFSGTDSFTYTISDGQGGAATATVTVTVVPDGAPVARPDQAATAAGAPVRVAVLANDSDPDGDPLTVTGATAPNGVVAINPDGSLTYTPNAGFSGVDTVTYAVSDGRGGTAGSTVAVTVQPAPNGAPRARPDQAATTVGAPVKVAVLANDTDPDGDPLTVTAVGAPTHGAVSRNPDGTLTYTPDAGFTGVDSFTYTVSDGRGGSASATVDVTVGPAPNVAPDARPDRATTVPGTPVVVAVLANDSDPDGDPLTVTNIGAPAHGAATLNPDGTLTYTPAPGFVGVDSFTYAVSDGRGGVATSVVDVAVGAADNAPPTARRDQAATPSGTPVTVAVLANDSDPDGDPLVVTGASAPHGAVALNPDGTLTYTPEAGFTGVDTITYTISDGRGGAAASTVDVAVGGAPNGAPTARPDRATTADGAPVVVAVLGNDSDPDGDALAVTAAGAAHGAVALNPDGTITYTPDAGFNGVDTITYSVSDGHGGTASSTVTVTVANGAPVANPDQATTAGGAPVTVAVLGNDTDPDGDPLTLTGASAGHGGVALNPDGTITYTPDAGFNGVDTITYSVSDGHGGTASSTVTVTVANGAPVANPDQATTAGGAPVTVAVLGNDTDPDGDPLTLTGASAGHGGVALNPDGTITYTPDAGFSGVDTVTYSVADGHGGTASSTVTVTVADGAPVANPDQATTAGGAPVTVAVLANDTDPDGDPLTVTGASAGHGGVTLNPDGTITYTPDAGFSGVDTVTYSVSDGRGGAATSTVSIAVADGAPVVRPDQASTSPGAPVTVAVLANDTSPDGAALTVTGASAGHGVVVVNPDGSITYTPDAGFVGTDTVRYTVVSADGFSGESVITVGVGRTARPTADVEELLRFGRGVVPGLAPRLDPGPGEFAPDAPPALSVHDALVQARTLNDTGISRHPVDDAVDAIRRLDATFVDSAAPVAAEVARLSEGAHLRDAGERAFDPRWSDFAPKPLSGFSCAADSDSGVMFDSVVRGGAIYLNMQDVSIDGRAPLLSFSVWLTAGGALPAWIRVDSRGLTIIERPADVDELHLTLEAVRRDGRVVRTPVVIQGATGEIELDRRAAPAPAAPTPRGHAHPAPHGGRHGAPLDHTLSTLQARRRHEAAALHESFR